MERRDQFKKVYGRGGDGQDHDNPLMIDRAVNLDALMRPCRGHKTSASSKRFRHRSYF
jgi:hypothetical protein